MGHKRLKWFIRLFIVNENMWEYKRTDYEFTKFTDLEDKLNEEGKDNWEVASYEEEKPKKFGDDFKVTVLYKKRKSRGTFFSF
jgi:hypothetical protein